MGHFHSILALRRKVDIMEKAVFLKEGFVNLRPLSDEDLPLLHTWHNNPLVTKYSLSGLVLPSTKNTIKEFIETSVTPKIVTFGISIKGKLIGYIGLSSIDYINRFCEYFIFIGEEKNWGKGYGYKASKLIIKYAFQSLNLNRVELSVSDLNKRAVKLYKKLGFKIEGIKREARFRDGKYHDKVMMAILRSEYKEK